MCGAAVPDIVPLHSEQTGRRHSKNRSPPESLNSRPQSFMTEVTSLIVFGTSFKCRPYNLTGGLSTPTEIRLASLIRVLRFGEKVSDTFPFPQLMLTFKQPVESLVAEFCEDVPQFDIRQCLEAQIDRLWRSRALLQEFVG